MAEKKVENSLRERRVRVVKGPIGDFFDFISFEKGLAGNTSQSYLRDLEQLEEFCRMKKTDLLKADARLLRDFVASLRRREVSLRSIARKVSTLRQFYQFCLREGKTTSDPSELLSIRLQTKKLPKHLTVNEMVRLVQAPSGEDEVSIRDRALLEMWYATGARVTELLSVSAGALDWKEGAVRIKGKGGRERYVPLNETALEWCVKYKNIRHEWVRRLALKTDEEFFLNRRGKRMSRQFLWRLVKHYAEKAGISRNIWPHMIRHSFATHVLQGGADLRAVQELLGHKSIATTEVYTHLNIENLKIMQQKYHPRS